jgi:Family of unknown function (DUF5677)
MSSSISDKACRDDFGEVVFLAVHGHGNGATEILRGMFERAVTTAYLIKHPAKAERFVRYAAIQEHRAMAAALKVLSEKEFDEALATAKGSPEYSADRNSRSTLK